MRTSTDKIYCNAFAVGERLYGYWDCNPKELNLDFLKSVDSEYFKYLADTHSASLTGSHKFRAAVAMRTAYFHGLETLFSLIFAGLHAPAVLPAWILKCRTEDLRNLVQTINLKRPISNLTIQLDEYSWKFISGFFTGVALGENPEQDSVADDFGELWQMFGVDYLNYFHVHAYNSFKHGFRVRLQGMKISFAPQEKPDSIPTAEKIIPLGESEIGASFYIPDSVKNAPNIKPDPHFRIKECHVNCYPEYTAESLRLIAISIYNVVACLNRLVGGERLQGQIPTNKNWLGDLRAKRTGLTDLCQDMAIHEEDIKRFTTTELQQLLDSGKGTIKIDRCH